MDRSTWEKVFISFQAFARGHLVRNEVRSAREDFEDIVEEIDGGLSHLQWRDMVIAIPHFTDTHGPFLRASSSTSKPSDPGIKFSSSLRTPPAEADTCLPQEKGRDQHVQPEKIEAERDESQTKHRDCDSRVCSFLKDVEGDGQRQRDVREQQGENGGGAMESIGDSTSAWSSLDLDMNYVHSQDVPRTTEALRVHRNTLTMELVWLQQAIDSRKKYLSLRERLHIS